MADCDGGGIIDQLPPRFWSVTYDGEVTPKNAPHRLNETANCLVYAYDVLAHFGLEVPRYWSSELWADVSSTRIVDGPEPLDLMLFAAEPVAYAAHVGVYVGGGRVLHLCKEVGEPVVWPLAEFAARQRYRTLVGIKRVVV
jgi:cell wall-associated NlpC family hydrolase